MKTQHNFRKYLFTLLLMLPTKSNFPSFSTTIKAPRSCERSSSYERSSYTEPKESRSEARSEARTESQSHARTTEHVTSHAVREERTTTHSSARASTEDDYYEERRARIREEEYEAKKKQEEDETTQRYWEEEEAAARARKRKQEEQQKLEQIKQAQAIEAEKIRKAKAAQIAEEQRVAKLKAEQEQQKLEQIRQAQAIEAERVCKIKEEEHRLEQVRQAQILEQEKIRAQKEEQRRLAIEEFKQELITEAKKVQFQKEHEDDVQQLQRIKHEQLQASTAHSLFILRNKNSYPKSVVTTFYNIIQEQKIEQLSEDDIYSPTEESQTAIKLFIPTKEFYEQNTEFLNSVKDFNGHPVFIPKSLRSGKKYSFIHYDASVGNSGNYAAFSPFNNGGMAPYNPFGPKKPKDDQDSTRANLIGLSAIAAAQLLGAGVQQATLAGGLGAITVLTPPVAIMAGGSVVIGYLATVVIPGCKTPVQVEIPVNTKKMTPEQQELYTIARQQYDAYIEKQNKILISKHINELAYNNGLCVQDPSSPKIDLPEIDPTLMYVHGPLQRLLDISSPIYNSTNRLAVQDDKVVKFTNCDTQDERFLTNQNRYQASIVQDLSTLSKYEQASLNDYWNFNVKKKLKAKAKKEKQQAKEAKKNNNSGPGKDPKDNDNNLNKAAKATAAKKAKDKIEKNINSANKNNKGGADKFNKNTYNKNTYDHKTNKFTTNTNDLIHMFRKKEGHVPNTPENQERILNMVRDTNNCLGIDDYGVVSYVQLEADGSQLWAEVNPNTQQIRNCGINKPDQTKTWNPETGLKAIGKNGQS